MDEKFIGIFMFIIGLGIGISFTIMILSPMNCVQLETRTTVLEGYFCIGEYGKHLDCFPDDGLPVFLNVTSLEQDENYVGAIYFPTFPIHDNSNTMFNISFNNSGDVGNE